MRISDWSSDVCSSDLLVDDQTKRRAGEIDRLIAAVHLDLAGAGLQPDARDGILAAAGGIGAALRVDMLCAKRRARLLRNQCGRTALNRLTDGQIGAHGTGLSGNGHLRTPLVLAVERKSLVQ